MTQNAAKTVNLPLAEAAPTDAWYRDGLRFACTGCGHCCSGGPGYVWVTPADIARIADTLKMPIEAVARQYVRSVDNAFCLTEKVGYDCIFLERPDAHTTRCRIYEVRPTQCRTWPFWNANLKSADAWKRASQSCPGMRATEGKVFPLAEIEQRRLHPESPG